MTTEETRRTLAVVLYSFGKQHRPRQVISPEDGTVYLENVTFQSGLLQYTDDKAKKNVRAVKSSSQIDVDFGSERGVLRFSYTPKGSIYTREGSFNVDTKDNAMQIGDYLYKIY